ncbi:MAG: carboxypeptidase-like regulatory domain-containing protein [Bacteroidia bacterium]|nr:carboxypeptidase-like regulatory domain-containing protein [Bacteroidia bacterium]
MSDKNKNKRNMLPDFLRYQRGEMTGEERNSFERELQKDPFTEEAAEGYATISAEEASNDIVHLQKRLKSRFIRRQKFLIYRIAASVAVLMVISTVFVIVERNKSGKELNKIAVQTEALEITETQPLTKQAAKDEVSEKPTMIAEKKTGKLVDRQIRMEPAQGAGVVENAKIAVVQIFDSIPETKLKAVEGYVTSEQMAAPLAGLAKEKTSSGFRAKGRILSSEDNMPVPGANVLIKGTSNGVTTDAGGNFNITLPDSDKRTLVANYIGMEPKEFDAKADSQLEVRLDPSVAALSEAAVVGYGAKRADSEKGEAIAGYVPPKPLNGKADFDKYIQENIHRPDTATAGQRIVVVLNFLVHTDGSIDSIKVVKSPGKPFSDEAIRLIKSGPSWKPAEENGKIIEDEVRVRIVFR